MEEYIPLPAISFDSLTAVTVGGSADWRMMGPGRNVRRSDGGVPLVRCVQVVGEVTGEIRAALTVLSPRQRTS